MLGQWNCPIKRSLGAGASISFFWQQAEAPDAVNPPILAKCPDYRALLQGGLFAPGLMKHEASSVINSGNVRPIHTDEEPLRTVIHRLYVGCWLSGVGQGRMAQGRLKMASFVPTTNCQIR